MSALARRGRFSGQVQRRRDGSANPVAFAAIYEVVRQEPQMPGDRVVLGQGVRDSTMSRLRPWVPLLLSGVQGDPLQPGVAAATASG